MLIRKLILVFFTLSCLSSFALAQDRIYLEYNNDCMTRLEYKLTSQTYKGNVVNYCASSSPSTKLILEMKKGDQKRLAGKPNYLIPCHRVQYNESLMRKSNTGETEIYVVGRDKNGYWAHYVESISVLKDNGKNVSYNSFTYGFEYPSNSIINPSANLTSNIGYNDIMFRGVTGLSCMDLYTFRKTPKHALNLYTDITFSPKLGILRSVEIENPLIAAEPDKIISTLDLMYINNLPVDDYVNSSCQNNVPKDPTLREIPFYSYSSSSTASNGFPSRSYETTTTTTTVPPSYSTETDEFTSRSYERNTMTTGTTVTTPVIAKPNVNNFANGIPAVTEYGEPDIPLENYVVECDAYKKLGFHIVKPRQNLFSISKMTGVSMENLLEWNGISDKNRIAACSELRLTPPTPDMYEVLEQKKIEAEIAMHRAATEKAKAEERATNKAIAQEKAAAKKAAAERAIAEKKAAAAKKILAEQLDAKERAAKAKQMAELRAKHLAELKAAKAKQTAEVKKDELAAKGETKIVNKKPSEELAAEENIHIVKNGETLYTIAKRYGFTSEKFMEINGLTSDIITPAMRLKTSNCTCDIPEDYTPKGGIPDEYDIASKIIKESSVVHRLKAGETLYRISNKYGVSVDRIILLNDIKDPKDLSVGQDLIIK